MKNLKIFEDVTALSLYAAGHFVSVVHKTIQERGYSNVALSGGSTPRQMYSLLAGDRYIQKINWDRVHLFWGDERCVPPDHQDSNFFMTKQILLDHVPIPQLNVHRIKGELAPKQAAAEYERELRSFFSRTSEPYFDLILLGLGDDAHTASLFPGTDALSVRNAWVAANFVPKLQDWRITLTPPVINGAPHVTFIVAGTQKADSLRHVMKSPYQPDLYPAQIVQPAGGKLLWLVDREAASLIEEED
jgi:6-phosphogluconolactonase